MNRPLNYQPTHYARSKWQRAVLYLYTLCYTYGYLPWIRPAYKRLLHLVTGKCEIERVCNYNARYNRTLLLGQCCDLDSTSKANIKVQRTLSICPSTSQSALQLADVDQTAQHIVRTKYIQNSRLVAQLTPLLERIQNRHFLIRTLKDQAATHVTEQHRALIDQLWHALKADQPVVWEEIGFQSSDPKTDFRAMGLLGLLNLVQFARKYPKTARHVLKLSNHVTYWFPFAITGINITANILRQLDSAVLDDYFYRHGASSDTFVAIYATFYYHFAEHYHSARPRDVMEFPRLYDRFNTVWHDFHFWQKEFPSLTLSSNHYTPIEVIEDQL